MESKIEKLERVKANQLKGMMGEVAPQWVAKELNKIIDHLNSQDQAEGKECECCKWDDMGYTHEPYCPLFKEYKQDTPEEWVEKLWELIDVYRDSKDINSELERIEEVNQYVKQLLKEREREAREEGRREVLNKETFVGDYDILMEGLHIRTIDRENFLAQIYKTVKERYDWAFGTATYKQALKMIENSLTSPLTPYVGMDKMIDEARIEVISKLTTK